MKVRPPALAAAAVVIVVAILLVTLGGDSGDAPEKREPIPGQPAIDIVSPRNGSRQENRSVVVHLKVENFRLAPGHFGAQPLLGEGHIRFSLNRVPDCLDPEKLDRAINSPTGRGRFIGRSFDYPEYAGPNGILAEQIGTAGIYSPATQPKIFYERLPPGFYRLTVNLARNDGTATPYNAATNFEVLGDVPGDGTTKEVSTLEEDCPDGKVSSAEATGS